MSSASEDDELEDRLCLALYRASHAMTAVYRTLLDPLGLTYPQYVVMSALWRTDPLTIRDLGEVLRSDYNTMSPLIKRLELKHLVRRTRSATDEREVLVHLTETARALEPLADTIQSDVQRAVGLDERDRTRLVAELQDLARGLQRADADASRVGQHAG